MQSFEENIISCFTNLWRYAGFYPEGFALEKQLYIDKKFTKLEKSKHIKNIDLYLKREDQSLTGSLKSRGLAYQLSIAKKENYKKFVISTSGNAGITTNEFLKKYGGELIVITSDSIPDYKIQTLKENCKNLIIADNPPHIANYISKKYGYKNLRPSRDANSIPGYYSLGFEIYEQLKKAPDHIFTYSTSGSSFIGIFSAFKILKEMKCIKKIPALHAVHKKGIKTYRKDQIDKICKLSSGNIIEIQTKEHDSEIFNTSFEGRCTLQAIRKIKPKGLVVGIITGQKFPLSKHKQNNFYKVNNIKDVDKFMHETF